MVSDINHIRKLNWDELQEALTILQIVKTEWNHRSGGRYNKNYELRFVEKVIWFQVTCFKEYFSNWKMSPIVILFVSRFKLILYKQDLIGEILLPIKRKYFCAIQDFHKDYLKKVS